MKFPALLCWTPGLRGTLWTLNLPTAIIFKQEILVLLLIWRQLMVHPCLQDLLPTKWFLWYSSLKADHRETIRFQLITSPKFPVILIIPWFSSHNPSINWSARTIDFASPHCEEYCRELCQTSFPLIKESQVDVVTIVSYDNLPPHYHKFVIRRMLINYLLITHIIVPLSCSQG